MNFHDLINNWRPHLLRLVSFLVFVGALAACGPTDQTPTPAPTNDSRPAVSTLPSDGSDAYPAPLASPTTGPYPPPATAAPPTANPYPGPESTPVALDAPRFAFDSALYAGDTVVTGQAPPNLSLAVSDVTFGSVPLGVGRSDAQGRFSIPVSPLPEGHRIGLTFADLEPGKSFEDMVQELDKYRGEAFMSVPNIGVFFTTTLVQPAK